MTRLACISDLHGQRVPPLPDDIDVVIVAGDCTARDTPADWRAFAEWFKGLDAKHKILVPGNHDGGLLKRDIMMMLRADPALIYLKNSGTCIDDINFWGFPYTPTFGDWHFMADEEEMKMHVSMIPDFINVLISHGPAWGCLDDIPRRRHVGCKQLAERICYLPDLKAHIFGHIHECGGKTREIRREDGSGDGSAYTAYNVAHCNRDYVPTNGWRVIEL